MPVVELTLLIKAIYLNANLDNSLPIHGIRIKSFFLMSLKNNKKIIYAAVMAEEITITLIAVFKSGESKSLSIQKPMPPDKNMAINVFR